MECVEVLTKHDCQNILYSFFSGKMCNILGFCFDVIEKHVEGFLSSSRKLVIDYSMPEDPKKSQQLSFFAKTLPRSNEFHEEYVLNIGGFGKEVFFFDKVKPNLDLWLELEVIPKCYLAVPDKIVVLELLTNHWVKDISDYFNQEEIKAAIASLASLHAASMMCESKNGLDFKSVWGDFLYDTLFSEKEGHLGLIHVFTGVKAIKAIIEKNYPEINKDVKKKAFAVLEEMPESVKPSKLFRNVISHGDLYTNNIMFTSNQDKLQAKIVDFQLFRLSPPALDLLMLIYSTADPESIEAIDDLTNYYYDQLSEHFTRFNFDADLEFPRREFQDSLKHERSLAIAITLLYQHFVNLPPNILNVTMNNSSNLKKFFIDDRSEIVLSSFEFDATYRNKVSSTISRLFDSVSN